MKVYDAQANTEMPLIRGLNIGHCWRCVSRRQALLQEGKLIRFAHFHMPVWCQLIRITDRIN
jgi:hypothetical protein